MAVDISVPGTNGRRRRRGIQIHRSLSLLPASVTNRHGISVTTPARTISDLRRAAQAQHGNISPQDLRRAIRQADVLGLPLGPQPLIDRTRSELEFLFLRLCRRHRLPAPEVNVRVGSLLADFVWREQRLIVETDGYRYHRGRTAFEDDHVRDLDLRGFGYEVVRLTFRQVTEEPERVAAILAQRLS
jgi:very-short-patch-repair endonuclease